MPKQPKSELSPTDFGSLELVKSDEFTLSGDGITSQPVDWRFNRRVLRCVPESLRLPLQIVRDENGFRRVLPRTSLKRFLLCAAYGGRVIFNRKWTTSGDERQSHRLMFLLFQWSFRNRRVLNREFRREEDLWLHQTERADPTQEHILPEIYEGNRRGRPELLNPTQLLEWGRIRAAKLEVDTGSTSQLINLGLLEAAARSPDHLAGLPPEQIQGMLRISLLGLNQGKTTNDPTLIAQIEERLIEAVQKHLDLNAKDFHRWLWEDFDNLVQQISQRRGGDKVSRSVVRFVLYDLLWRAHSFVDNFVRLQMQAVRNRLEPEMTPAESRVFGFWYEKQAWLGNLAAVMFHHRFDLISLVLTELDGAEINHDRIWRNLLQAMYWKTEMVENRRQADQTQKERRRNNPPNDTAVDHG